MTNNLSFKEISELASKRLHRKYTIDKNDCWLFTGATTQGGYGLLTVRGKQYYTHRLMAALYFPDFKETDHIMHICDVRACMNPEHLMLGSIRLNNQDMFEKGRARPTGRIPTTYRGKNYDEFGELA